MRVRDGSAVGLKEPADAGLSRPGVGRSNLAVAAAAAALAAILGLTVPHFMEVRNLLIVLQQLSILGFMSIGMTFVMVSGGIDLSTYTVVSAAAVVGASAMAAGRSAVLGCCLMLLVGIAFGAVNGVAIAWGRMIPFIVTLSTMVLAQGFAIWYTQAQSISDLPDGYIDTVAGTVAGGIPVPALIILAVAAVAHVVLAKTQFGRWLFLAGSNEQAARISGIPVRGARLAAYVFSGAMAGVTAVVVTAMLGTATTAMVQDDRLMDVIATTVIGGAGLSGGTGSVLGTMLGLLFLTVLGNAFNLLGVPPFVAMVIKGVILVAVIGLDVLRSRRAG